MRFDRRLARQLAPFAATTLVGFAIVPIQNSVRWSSFVLAAGLTVVLACGAAFSPSLRLPPRLRIVVPLLFLVAVALLRDAGGGTAAGVGALAMLPVFWVALHGGRGELLAIIAGVCAFFVAPAVLVGGAEYPLVNWRLALTFAAAAAIVGITVQNLVARVREHAEALAVRERDLEAMADLSRTLSGATDARDRLCVAACDLSGAQFAALLENRDDGTLVRTATAGLDPASPDGPAAMVFEPVRRGDDPVGLLVVGWHEPPPDRSRTTGLLRLLASEAAFVIERADLLGRLTEIALTDTLTGLPNRRAWDTRLAQAIRDHEPICVAILDLDFFKAFNDAHGHQAGDRLLKEAAAAWRGQLRTTDMLARYGGEEFVVLLNGHDPDVARRIVERVRDATPRGQSCSAGIACREAGEDAATLLGRADDALYEAKRAGRDRSAVALGGSRGTSRA
jgi:diguanylate cyclase (GGDEF)-like protein